MVPLVVLLLCSLQASAQLPDFYKQVERIILVTDDLDRVAAAWKKTGHASFGEAVTADGEDEYRGQVSANRFRWAQGSFANLIVDIVQPVSGRNAYSDFLAKQGTGVMALVYRVPSAAALEAETARLRTLGVPVLQRRGDAYAMFDTEAGGKYVLTLIADTPPPPPAPPAGAPPVTQFAFAVRDLDSVSKYWAKLGWPEMTVTDPGGQDRIYRGKPGEYTMKLGWHRHGKIPFEWILSTKGPNVYDDHMGKHGEGFHHLAFNVNDIDKAAAEWAAWGFPPSQSGSWGEKGKKGSGRYAYHDLHAVSGIDIELIWNYRGQ